MEKISVIIPVYKVESYLRQCIDSVLIQSYSNLEIILVDDGSPDGCPAICDQYATEDARIKVIHKPNGGLSDARNAGLDVATGDYIGFVDSDDWISPTMYEELLSAIHKYGAELACCGYIRTDGTWTLETMQPGPECRISGKDFLRDIFTRDYGNVVAWNKLYSTKLFANLRFPYGEIHEDTAVFCKTIGNCCTAAYTGTIGYYYRFRSDSIVNASSLKSHITAILKDLGIVKEFVAQVYPELKEEASHYDAEMTRYLFFIRFESGLSDTSPGVCELKQYLRKNLGRFMNDKYLSPKARAEVMLMFLGVYLPAQKVWRSGIKLWRILETIIARLKQTAKYLSSLPNYSSILFNTPLHGNLGDHAIAMAETELFSSLGIPVLDYPWGKRVFSLLSRMTPKNKMIFIHGGGNLGDLWPNEEKTTRRILHAFRRNRIVIFPQTVHFDLETEQGRRFFDESKACYSSHPALTIFVREKISFEFMNTYMPEVKTVLVPDMVMLLRSESSQSRKGALICLRNDLEKTLPEQEKCELLRTIRTYFTDIKISDTVFEHQISLEERETAVNAKLAEFASSELVVTDRLHGMIFAAITETPCIVINSLSHKIRGCYEAWLKDLDYIRFAENVGEMPEMIEALRKTKPVYRDKQIAEAMEPLRALIKHEASQSDNP